MISSGKSTFLNSILRGNYLSISTNVETSFICILRHNKYLNQVPKLYKCKIIHKRINYEYNDFNYYHFEKKEEIEGDILSNIRKINEDLRQYENEVSINKRDINRYFYIMELNMQLFENNNELGNYFDFSSYIISILFKINNELFLWALIKLYFLNIFKLFSS